MELENWLTKLHQAATRLDAIEQTWQALSPEYLPIKERWKNSCAYGGWWGYTILSDGTKLGPKWRTYPMIETQASVKARTEHDKLKWKNIEAAEETISNLIKGRGWPGGAVTGLFRRYSANEIIALLNKPPAELQTRTSQNYFVWEALVQLRELYTLVNWKE